MEDDKPKPKTKIKLFKKHLSLLEFTEYLNFNDRDIQIMNVYYDPLRWKSWIYIGDGILDDFLKVDIHKQLLKNYRDGTDYKILNDFKELIYSPDMFWNSVWYDEGKMISKYKKYRYNKHIIVTIRCFKDLCLAYNPDLVENINKTEELYEFKRAYDEVLDDDTHIYMCGSSISLREERMYGNTFIYEYENL